MAAKTKTVRVEDGLDGLRPMDFDREAGTSFGWFDRWQIGQTLLEVSEPRIPCRVFAGFWKRQHLVKEFTEAARPGAYLRVIEGGFVSNDRERSAMTDPKYRQVVADSIARGLMDFERRR